MFLTAEFDGSQNSSIAFKVSGSGYALEPVVLTGVEWRPKEVPNLGLFAEMGYGIDILGNISASYTANGQSQQNLTITPNAYYGQTFYGLGVIWHF
jgi:hypothetical protein